ncbi:hypothetical protein Tco_0243683, partial [Tanacetum coccineum]
MKEKGDPCILVGYSTQSKGYRNKRTRLIVESIHLRFDEIKEMLETSVANDTSVIKVCTPQEPCSFQLTIFQSCCEFQNLSSSSGLNIIIKSPQSTLSNPSGISS